MKKLALIYILCIIMVVTIIETSSHLAFAATYQVTITQGSGAGQSCVATANCYDPSNLQIAVGDTVTWVNQDSIGHTVTSGNPSDTQTGTIFDSSLISSGRTFSFTFTQAGTYTYFDLIHLWMTGTITVIPSLTQTSIEPSPQEILQSGYSIPQWVRNVAKWWGEGQIEDSDFIKGLQYLIDQKILVTQQSQNKIQYNGEFKLVYDTTTDPDQEKIKEVWESSFGTTIDTLNKFLALPTDVTIRFTQCGVANSFYDPQTRQITMCYDLMQYFLTFYSSIDNSSAQIGQDSAGDHTSSGLILIHSS